MDLKYSTVSRITGEDELLAVSVKETCNANRLQTEGLERIDTISHYVQAVGTTRVALGDRTNRGVVLLQNQGAQIVYIGNATVTSANGFILHKGASMTLSLSESVLLYAVTATGTSSLFVMEGTHE